MRVIAKRALRDFWARHPDAREPQLAWYRQAKKEDWATPSRVLAKYPTASLVGSDRVVFRIKGNRYRLVTHFVYRHRTVFIRFVGTHAQYDRINAREI